MKVSQISIIQDTVRNDIIFYVMIYGQYHSIHKGKLYHQIERYDFQIFIINEPKIFQSSFEITVRDIRNAMQATMM